MEETAYAGELQSEKATKMEALGLLDDELEAGETMENHAGADELEAGETMENHGILAEGEGELQSEKDTTMEPLGLLADELEAGETMENHVVADELEAGETMENHGILAEGEGELQSEKDTTMEPLGLLADELEAGVMMENHGILAEGSEGPYQCVCGLSFEDSDGLVGHILAEEAPPAEEEEAPSQEEEQEAAPAEEAEQEEAEEAPGEEEEQEEAQAQPPAEEGPIPFEELQKLGKYTCYSCGGRATLTYDGLMQHNRARHNGWRFNCTECCNAFKSNRKRNVHFMRGCGNI